MLGDGMNGREPGGSGQRPRITVVIPCLNEEQGLPRVLKAIPAEVEEILVLDNCSTDRTVEVAEEDERVRVVRHPHNLGYGGSYIRGLPMVRGDVIVTSDGDGTYPVQDCLELVDALVEGGYDFLSCSRFPLHDRTNMSFRNRFGNRLLNTLVNAFYGLHLKDAQSGMWVFRTAVLDEIRLTSTGMALSHEIKLEAFTSPRVKAGEIRIPYAERVGTSKLYPVRDGVRMVRFLLTHRFSSARRRDTAPLGRGPRLPAADPPLERSRTEAPAVPEHQRGPVDPAAV
jgi:glycosyltransferase involved in cell wall biosynthesis